MSVVVNGQNLGSPLVGANAMRDLVRLGVDAPELFGVLRADEQPTSVEYRAKIRSQARRALADHGHKLSADSRGFISRVAALQ